jgi:DNA-directed RNA polymerase
VVARLLKEGIVDPLAASGDAIAKLWQGKDAQGKDLINRKLVKPATMTTPYGVTEVGIRRQLLAYIDENLKGRFPKAWTAANWLAPRLQLVIGSVVVKGVEIMTWLREIADLMAEANRGLAWMTPIGLPVVQERRKPMETRIPTLAHSFVHYEHDPKGEMDAVAQQNGIVANIVHSIDASHMMLTVRALHARGIRDYSMVHDSYAVHACDVDIMNEVLRDTFVAMHEQFTLAHLIEQFRRIAPKGLPLREPPALGALDLSAVRQSAYFFC